MSTTTLKQKAQDILDEKQAKIIPENFPSGLQIFDIHGNIPVKNSGEGTLSIDTDIEVDNSGVKFKSKTDTIYKTGSYMSKSNSDVAQAIGLNSSKIKSGETILGVNGTVEELRGETRIISPSTSQQIITPNSAANRNAFTQVTVDPVTYAIDNNISAENIKSGVNILNITGNFTSDANATSNDILSGKTAYVNGVKLTGNIDDNRGSTLTGELSTLSDNGEYLITVSNLPYINTTIINNTTQAESFIPYGDIINLKDITSNIIKKDANIFGVNGTVVELNGTTLNANLSNIDQSIEPESPYNAFTVVNIPAVTASVDSNIAANNIKNGVNILGVTGNFAGVDTSDATAIDKDIKSGKTAYVNGVKITGAASSYDGTDLETGYGELVVPQSGGGIVAVDNQFLHKGYAHIHDVNVKIPIMAETLAGYGLTANNIKSGTTILGITGNYSGTDTSDATASVSDIAANKTAYVNGSKITGNVLVVNSGEKTYGNGISATAQSYGLDIVANISVDQLLRQNSQFETTALNNTLATAVNLTADKLKKDVTLLGVTGNYEGLNTADANATAADIIENKTAYVNGIKLIGTLNTLNQAEYNQALNTVNSILGV